MSRRAIVTQLAPEAPPCFADRRVWIEFLVSAAEATKGGRIGPVDLRHSQPTFNAHFDFCDGCLAKHALAMDAQGRCQPGFLLASRENAGTAVPGASVGSEPGARLCERVHGGGGL